MSNTDTETKFCFYVIPAYANDSQISSTSLFAFFGDKQQYGKEEIEGNPAGCA